MGDVLIRAGVRAVAVFLIATSAMAQTVRITGEISDSQCAFNVHSNGSSHTDIIKSGTVGKTARQCTQTCVRTGGKYVLIDTVNRKIYHLANPEKVADFAAAEVRVRGSVDQDGVLTVIAIENR